MEGEGDVDAPDAETLAMMKKYEDEFNAAHPESEQPTTTIPGDLGQALDTAVKRDLTQALSSGGATAFVEESELLNGVLQNVMKGAKYIQLVVGYTSGAAFFAAKKATPTQTQAAVRALVKTAVVQMNQSYQRSKLNVRAKLLAVLPTKYQPPGNTLSKRGMKLDLNELQKLEKGRYSDLIKQLPKYAPDVTALLVDPRYQKCGKAAKIMAKKATEGFVVVDIKCMASARYSLAHETGHILGCMHNANIVKARSTAHGHISAKKAAKWVTMMAYPNKKKGKPTRVTQFSNPKVMYQGEASGTTKQDNCAAMIAGHVNTVVKFRSYWRKKAPAPKKKPGKK
jgi:hypothetical protein